jgi:transketolase
MSDGEQHKGQVSEARRTAVQHGVTALTAIVDYNRVQISGHTREIMDVDVAADWAADGWRVVEVDGHDVAAIYDAVRSAVRDESSPTVVLCDTVIGKGVSFMEDDPAWHGAALPDEKYAAAMEELGLPPYLEEARVRRGEGVRMPAQDLEPPRSEVATGGPRTYGADERTDNRSAWGAALADIASANPDVPMAVLDCDLVPSVKTGEFADVRPEGFLQFGVGEHNAAAAAGALSVSDVLTFWSDFGVFGIDEVYNQQRLNDINHTSVKLVVTHCGLDVGEDGKTHHCIDYVGVLKNVFGWRVVVPADPNQTDRAVRWAAGEPGNIAIAMGRSKLPVITAHDGAPLFGGDTGFEYGRIAWAREGSDGTLLAMGTVAGSAVEAADELAGEGVHLAVGIVACPLDLDEDAMLRAAGTGFIATVEDHNVRTGLGASVAEWLGDHGVATRLMRLGVERYSSSGDAADLLESAGLDARGIAVSLRMALGS